MTYDTLASDETLHKLSEGLVERGFIPVVVDSGKEALEKIIATIPEGATVMNGLSTTLEQIGFMDYLKSDTHTWNNLHKSILLEPDYTKQLPLRRKATLSEYYLGSVHAITESGEMVIASGTGSQLPHIVFNSQNLILIVSTKKITPTLSDALQRLENHVVPLENDRMMKKIGKGTIKSKTLILHRESPMYGRKIHVILVKENLGF